MAEGFKTISSKHLIQRVFANNSINNANWTADAFDWIPQGVGFIGKHGGLNIKVCCNMRVIDHHTCYPHDFEGLIAVMYKGKMLPLGSDLSKSDIMKSKSTCNSVTGLLDQNSILQLNLDKARLEELISEYASNPTSETAELITNLTEQINVETESMATMSLYVSGRGTYCSGEFFNTQLDYIQTSFETGYISLIYAAFPVDNEGYLRVIDNEWYLDALEWYILMMLIKKGYQHPLFDWKTVRQEWFTARGRAANQLKIPTLAQQERFARMWEQCKFRRNLPDFIFNRTEQTFGLIY